MPRVRVAEQPLDALAHLAGGLVGERDRQDLARPAPGRCRSGRRSGGSSTRVLPLPAPARISSGPSPCVTASRWGSLRPSSSSCEVLGVRVLEPSPGQHRCDLGGRPRGAAGAGAVSRRRGSGPLTVRSGRTSATGWGSPSESSATVRSSVADAARERLDRLGDRVGQVDPVGVGALDAAAVDAHRVAGVADDGASSAARR